MKENIKSENLKLKQIDYKISIAQRKIELMKRYRSKQRMIVLIEMFSNFESLQSIQIDCTPRDYYITYINNVFLSNDSFATIKDISNTSNVKLLMNSNEIKNLLFSQKMKSNILETELILFCEFFNKTSDDLDNFLCNQEINITFLKNNLNKRQFFK